MLDKTDEIMLSEFSFTGEKSGTDGALIRILLGFFHFHGMVFLMAFEIGELWKSTIASWQITFVGPFSRVFAHVLLQMGLLFKAFLTIGALVLALIRVHQLVLIEISFGGEGLGTFRAGVHLLRRTTLHLKQER